MEEHRYTSGELDTGKPDKWIFKFPIIRVSTSDASKTRSGLSGVSGIVEDSIHWEKDLRTPCFAMSGTPPQHSFYFQRLDFRSLFRWRKGE